MNNTHFNQIKYNQTIIDRQKQLLTELKQTQKELSEQQENCDHIRVCIGWNGPYLYRDTSICECLICGEKEPESNYPVIEAYNYKSELYSHGELESYRTERMSELQNLALNIISKKEDITTEQLVEIMSDIIKNPIASKYANLAIACLQYPESQLTTEEKSHKLIIRDTSYLKEKAKIVEIKKSEDYDRLVEEANARIEESRRREAKAWHDAQNYIVNYNEQGPVKKLVPNNKK